MHPPGRKGGENFRKGAGKTFVSRKQGGSA